MFDTCLASNLLLGNLVASNHSGCNSAKVIHLTFVQLSSCNRADNEQLWNPAEVYKDFVTVPFSYRVWTTLKVVHGDQFLLFHNNACWSFFSFSFLHLKKSIHEEDCSMSHFPETHLNDWYSTLNNKTGNANVLTMLMRLSCTLYKAETKEKCWHPCGWNISLVKGFMTNHLSFTLILRPCQQFSSVCQNENVAAASGRDFYAWHYFCMCVLR